MAGAYEGRHGPDGSVFYMAFSRETWSRWTPLYLSGGAHQAFEGRA